MQHLVEADVPFKTIGDYVGHRTAEVTQIYGKVAVDKLRELALGEAEEAYETDMGRVPEPTASQIEQYVATKRALGRKFDVEERTSRQLDRFLVERQIDSLAAITGRASISSWTRGDATIPQR